MNGYFEYLDGYDRYWFKAEPRFYNEYEQPCRGKVTIGWWFSCNFDEYCVFFDDLQTGVDHYRLIYQETIEPFHPDILEEQAKNNNHYTTTDF